MGGSSFNGYVHKCFKKLKKKRPIEMYKLLMKSFHELNLKNVHENW